MEANDTEWTDLRCSQLADLQRVLRTIRDANSSNNFLTKMKEASEIADELLHGQFPSFSMFLEMVAIRDRQQRRATAAPTAASEEA